MFIAVKGKFVAAEFRTEMVTRENCCGHVSLHRQLALCGQLRLDVVVFLDCLFLFWISVYCLIDLRLSEKWSCLVSVQLVLFCPVMVVIMTLENRRSRISEFGMNGMMSSSRCVCLKIDKEMCLS